MDRRMEMQVKRNAVLTNIAKENPKAFLAHVQRVLTRHNKKGFLKFKKQIDLLMDALPEEEGWVEYSERLKRSTSGALTYLRSVLGAKDYYVVAYRAGIGKEIIDKIALQRAEEIYPKNNSTDKIYSPKDKVSTTIWNGLTPNTITPIRTLSKDNQEYGAVLQFMRYMDTQSNTQIDIAYTKYEDYERQVCDAVVSLVYASGVPVLLTSEQIYRVTCQNPKAKLTEKAARDIQEAMLNCGRGEVTIVTDPSGDKKLWEAGSNGKLKPERKKYKVSPKYYGRIITFSASGSGEFNGILDRWKIYEVPILYSYAHDKNQVATTPIKQITTKVNRSKETQSILGYIGRRIDTMKKSPKQKRTILWDNIYKIDGVEGGSDNPKTIETKKRRTRSKTIKILDEFVEKGIITGYTYKNKENKKLKGKVLQYHSIGIIME